MNTNNPINDNTRIVNIDGTSLVREMGSKALKETNARAADEYFERRRIAQQKAKTNDDRINALENDIKEIKSALNILLERIPAVPSTNDDRTED